MASNFLPQQIKEEEDVAFDTQKSLPHGRGIRLCLSRRRKLVFLLKGENRGYSNLELTQ